MEPTFEKDAAISDVVRRLGEHFGPEVVVRDHWDADLCAIGISRADAEYPLVYISTYKRSPGRYFLSLEEAPKSKSDIATQVGDFDNLEFVELAERIAEHLRLK